VKPGDHRNYVRTNDYIRSPQVRLISETGEQLGVKPIQEALKLAREKGMDLIEIVPQSAPPICKIMDFSKYKYEQNQKMKEQKKKQRNATVIKEIRMRPMIGDHDLEFKLNHAREFIQDNHKVKLTVIFMGREMSHKDIGRQLMARIIEKLKDISDIESYPKMEGNRLIALFAPAKNKTIPSPEIKKVGNFGTSSNSAPETKKQETSSNSAPKV